MMIRQFFSALRISGFALIAFAASAPAAWAGPNDAAGTVWLASVTGDPTVGRLMIRDGALTFATPQREWQVPLTEIARVTVAKGDDRSLDIATITGEKLRLTIRGPQLLIASPKPAVQRIQRALREAPARRPMLLAAAPDAGSPRQN